MKRLVVTAALCVAGLSAQKPEGLANSTWLREDLFAGFLANDIERHNRGMQKVEDLLAANPKAPDVIAWKGTGVMTRAVKAYESGDRATFDRHYKEAINLLDEAHRMAPSSEGVFAIYGGTLAVFAPKLPPEHQKAAWEKMRQMYSGLYNAQAKTIEQMPLHFKGEVYAALAESEHRLGNAESSRFWLEKIVKSMPESPYQRTAAQWLANPEATNRSRLVCQTCHDPGRLEARLNTLPKKQ